MLLGELPEVRSWIGASNREFDAGRGVPEENHWPTEKRV